MKGRNEHTLKNHFISILRFVMRNAIRVRPNDFQDILEKFKNLKVMRSLKTQSHKCMLQIPDYAEEFAFYPKKLEVFHENTPKYSPNLTEIMKLSSNKKSLNEKPFVLSFLPEGSQNILKSDNNSLNQNYKKNNDSYEIESISQKISSLSFIDKIILESNDMNNNISGNSMRFSNLNSPKKSFLENSSSPSNSIFCLPASNDIMFEENEDNAKNKLLFSIANEQNFVDDFECDDLTQKGVRDQAFKMHETENGYERNSGKNAESNCKFFLRQNL